MTRAHFCRGGNGRCRRQARGAEHADRTASIDAHGSTHEHRRIGRDQGGELEPEQPASPARGAPSAGRPARTEADIEILRKYRDRAVADIFALQEVNGRRAAELVFPIEQWDLFFSGRYADDLITGRDSDRIYIDRLRPQPPPPAA